MKTMRRKTKIFRLDSIKKKVRVMKMKNRARRLHLRIKDPRKSNQNSLNYKKIPNNRQPKPKRKENRQNDDMHLCLNILFSKEI